jgi:hypothetical protein
MAQKLATDEGSKGGDRSVLTFAVVAAALIVALLIVGARGRQVTPAAAPAQPAAEAPATSGAPATPAPSGSTP